MLIILIRTVLIYIYVTLAVRIMGKRQISDMQTSELVITLIISDIAAIPMQNTDLPLFSGFIPITVLVVIEIVVSIIMLKSNKFRKVMCGNPIVIIKDGEILQDQLKKLRMTYEDLYSLLRQQEVFDVREIRYGIVETNGSVSILKAEESEK